MHASEKISLKKIGLIAGTGRLPEMLLSNWERAGFTPYIVALEGITDPDLFATREHIVLPIGCAGGIIEYLKNSGVKDIVLAGALKKPEWSQIRADSRGMKIILKVALRALGDDALLRVVREELESEGFILHGVQEYIPDILAPVGVFSETSPLQEDWDSIHLGFQTAKEWGRKDKGQSVVVQQGTVLGCEGNEGTKTLMEQAGKIKREGRGPILVKVLKPGQDTALDMPTIGAKTIETAHEQGFVGIVIEAGCTLVLDREEIVARANHHKIFLLGLKEE
jgi:DUF1009 family protein